MNSENLELRMYGLVPYNISPIQQGIQFGHSVVEYGMENFNNPVYQNWATDWKTFIILNGGTTNNRRIGDLEYIGTLNNHLDTLNSIGVINTTFHEPDLGDQLTAITFIVDERVFNKRKYPDFRTVLEKKYSVDHIESKSLLEFQCITRPKLSDIFKYEYEQWCETIGSPENVKLREFLGQFKLA